MQKDSPTILTSKQDDFPYYRRMRKRIVVALLFVSFFPLILIGGGMYYYATTALKQRTMEYLSQEVTKHKRAIDQFLTERTMDLNLLAGTMSLESLTQAGALERVFESLQEGCACFVDVGIIDDQGQHLAYAGPYDLIAKNYRDAEWFSAVMNSGVYISDVFLGFRKVPHFVIAVKRTTHGGVWVMRATIDTAFFDSIVSEVLGSRRGDAYLVNREGVFQTMPRSGGELMGHSEYKDMRRFEGVTLEEGSRHLRAMVWLERVPWLCVVTLDKDEIFAALHRVRTIGIAVSVLGGVLIVFTVLITTKYLVARLEVKRRDILQLDTQLRHTSTMASSMPLVSGFVREINETMAAIDGAARWIQDLIQGYVTEGKNAQEILESLTQIKSEVKRTRKVTDRILSLTRHTVPIIKEVQVNEILDDVLGLLERELRDKRIKVLREYDDHLPLIRNDPPQLRQVFQNILVYSIASLEINGKITASTGRRVGGVTVTVTDNGQGIPKEQLERLFEPRFTPRPGETSTGLPLSVSAGILERLGGRLSVQSESGKGTSFIVELPFHARGSTTQQT